MDKILKLLESGRIEIVSYGLAPNPNGFCYELDREGLNMGEVGKLMHDIDKALESLNKTEENQLRRFIFGEIK